ncbi:DoxX family protein [Roseivirga sp. E12]|uniref:DoxX family protein n=1 Tax=Roseivirga sp. E12 TaxID=2819237 RepID=UPI001ABCD26E|nr:DoxX family protein [Roseivirga sp. E12]MBO3700504.1 DoxX family protein [Roseivirga sp. E12]
MIKLFLRAAIGTSFLSAVADRFGLWPKEVSAWGNWESFIAYTQQLNPIVPESLIPALGGFVTAAEIIFALCLIIGFKTEYIARLSGILLLLFAGAMILSSGIKGVFDYSVLAASAAAFALSTMKEKYLELDLALAKREKGTNLS